MNNDDEYYLLNNLFDELFPLLRSITGSGIERSLQIICRYMPLEIFGVNSGTIVFDWAVPKSWHCNSAIIYGPNNEVICDLKNSNLHVVNYSVSVDRYIDLPELQKHIHSIPSQPDAIPYVTSYYKPYWGFCMSQKQRDKLYEGSYKVVIDSAHIDGRVPLAHTFLQGISKKEILISSYLCHPSLANNELSGPLVLLALYLRLSKKKLNFTYRFVLAPETIGSLCYLYKYADNLKDNLISGFVLTCLGGPETLSYKLSRKGDSISDKLARHWNTQNSDIFRIREFDPTGGSDERQYCSPGFNLPVGQFGKTLYGEYPEYHNSMDNKDFMSISSIVESTNQIERFILELDNSGPWINTKPYGEPQLSKRNLYPSINSSHSWSSSSDNNLDGRKELSKILYILNYSDGSHSIIDIADKCGVAVSELLGPLNKLKNTGLLKLADIQ